MLKRTQLTIKKWCLTPKEERMKYFIIIGVLFMCSFSQADRFYETEYGNINLSSLESILSSDMGGASVRDLTLRKTYNPIDSLLGVFSDYQIFVMSFVFDSFVFNNFLSHDMSCKLVIIKDENEIIIDFCESETASYRYYGTIDIRAVGLPLIIPIKHEYSRRKKWRY